MPFPVSRIARLLLLSLCAFAAAAPAFAGTDRWTLFGPTGSGVADVVVDPRSPDRMWIAVGTVYKSEDGGVTFHPSGNGLEGQTIWWLAIDPAVAPGEPPVLYASVWDHGSGVFRSRDGGAHWTRVADTSSIWSLEVVPGAPGQPGVVFVGDGLGLRSVDGGDSFQPTFTPGSVDILEAFAGDPRSPGTVYAATLYQRYKSTDFGSTWAPLDEDPEHFPPFVHDLVVAPGDPQTLYETGDGANAGATWRSHDGGATWEGPFEFRGDVLAVDPVDSNTVYGGSIRGLFVSHDGGETFKEATHGVPSLDINVTGYYGVYAIMTNPGRPGYALAATAKGLFATVDGGRTWQAAPMRNLIGNLVEGLRIDPDDPSHWVLSSLGTYIESHDGGRTFTPFAEALQREAAMYAAEFDPFVPHQLWALGYVSGVSLYVSKDDGATWLRLASQLPTGGQLLLPAPRVLLIANGDYVYRSADAGHSWRRAAVIRPAGRAQSSSFSRLQQDPRSPGTIYWHGYRSIDAGRTWRFWATGSAIAFDPFRPRTVHITDGDTLLVTRDAGASFQVVGHFGLRGYPSVLELLFDRVRRDVLYALTFEDGILRSRDGGATWEPLNDGLPPSSLRPGLLGTLTQDPAYSHRFYLTPDSGGLYRADFTGGPP